MTKRKARDEQAYSESGLTTLAKQFRIRAGVSKSEAARQLGVNRGTVHQAEEYPEASLAKLRSRMIERYSKFAVVGPVFLLRKR